MDEDEYLALLHAQRPGPSRTERFWLVVAVSIGMVMLVAMLIDGVRGLLS